jgi:hypothetical protein
MKKIFHGFAVLVASTAALLLAPGTARAQVATDAINLSQASVYNSPADIASWPVTAAITQITMAAPSFGLSFEFTKKDSWPDYTPPGWTGPLEYTVWAVVNINGHWYTAGFIQMWRGRASTGAPLLTIPPGSSVNNFAANWAYDARWGPMAGYQPHAGETVGFFVSAGNARGVGTVTSLRERSNVVTVQLPANDTGVFKFSATPRVTNDFNGDGKPDLVIRNYRTGENQILYLNGTTAIGSASLPTLSDLNWQAVALGDFNGDGHPDIVWRNAVTGDNAIWYLNGATQLGVVVLPTLGDLNWQIVGAADFDGDGSPDLLWRNVTTGDNAIWSIRGGAYAGVVILPSLSREWQMVATADFNQDGNADLLWRNLNTGDNAVWFMKGMTKLGVVVLAPLPDITWQIVSAMDVNGDGSPDIVWHNSVTGENFIWLMNGLVKVSGAALPTTAAEWRPLQAPIRPAPRDFNSDQHADIVWHNSATGANAVWFMNGTTELTLGGFDSIDPAWHLAVVTDLNGDGCPDFVWRNTSTGEDAIWYMRGRTHVSTTLSNTVADLTWDIVGAGDFLGEGTPQLVWRNRISGANLLWSMRAGAWVATTNLPSLDPAWSIVGTADMNRDGHPDLLLRNDSNGQVGVWLMNGASIVTVNVFQTVDPTWELMGATDMNGDGSPDLLWRNSVTGANSVWYLNGTTVAAQATLPSLSDLNWKMVMR